MGLIVRLKVGFFKKTAYRLEASKDELLLVPVTTGGTNRIVLSKETIQSVTLIQRESPELEIQTQDEVYSGTFEKGTSFDKVVNYFRDNISVTITCEYEGRN